MGKRADITDVSTGYQSNTTMNDNFEALNENFDNTLSRDGSTPNQMEADLDLNSNSLLNASTVATSYLYIGGVLVSVGDLEPVATLVQQEYATVALLAASTTSYTVGQYLRVLTGNYYYVVAASGATDHHLTTAGGVKLYALISPEGYYLDAFNPAGDSVTDDTTEVLLGIDTAGAADVPLILSNNKTYRFTGGTTDGDVRLKGGTLKLEGNLSLASDTDVVEIDGTTFDNSTGVGFLHSGGQDVIERAHIHNVKVDGGFGFHFNSGADDVLLTNSTFTNLATTSSSCQALRVGENTYAVSSNSSHIRAMNNYVNGVNSSSGDETHAFLIYGQDVVITGNTIVGVTNNNNTCEAIYTKSARAVISNNNLFDNGNSEDGHITVKGVDEDTTSSPQGNKIVIANNVVTDLVTSNLAIGIAVGANQTFVTGNSLYGTELVVLDADGVVVANNTIEATSTLLDGLKVEDSSNVTLIDNYVNITATDNANTMNGVQIRRSSSGSAENIVIKGGSIIYNAPNCTTGSNSVAALQIETVSSTNNVLIDNVTIECNAPSVANDNDRLAMYASGGGSLDLDIRNCYFKEEHAIRNLSTTTLKVNNNSFPATVNNGNVTTSERTIEPLYYGRDNTGNNVCTVNTGHIIGSRITFVNDNATYQTTVNLGGSDAFATGGTSEVISAGDTLVFEKTDTNLWAITRDTR